MASEVPKAWANLFDALGGKHVLARELRVSESTIWRWSRGETEPGAPMRELVNDMCKKHRVARVFVPAQKEKEAKHA